MCISLDTFKFTAGGVTFSGYNKYEGKITEMANVKST